MGEGGRERVLVEGPSCPCSPEAQRKKGSGEGERERVEEKGYKLRVHLVRVALRPKERRVQGQVNGRGVGRERGIS